MTDAPHPPYSSHQIDRRKLLTGAGTLLGASVLTSVFSDSVAHANGLPSGASRFVPLEPFRVVDARRGISRPARVVGTNRLRFSVAGYTDPGSRQRIAPDATAIVANVTAINGSQPGHVTVFPSNLSRVPTGSVMNLRNPAQVTANMVTTKLSPQGEFDIASLRDSKLVVDVLGYYQPVRQATAAGRLTPMTATRVYDSRRGVPRPRDKSSVVVDVTRWTRADSSAVVVNVAAVLSNGPGHVSAIPVWQTTAPTTSTLNLKFAGDIVSGSAIVPIRTTRGKRQIRIWAHTSCDVVVDIRGTYSGDNAATATDGLFVPLTPQRILDTRGLWPNKLGRALGQLWDNWIVETRLTEHAEISSSTARRIGAVSVNLTAFESRGFPRSAGHFTLSAAGLPVPTGAVVNWSQPGSYASNHVISEVSNEGLQIHTVTGASALIDLTGYFLGQPRQRRLRALAPTQQTPPAINPPWQLQVPNLWDSNYGQYGRWQTVIDHPDGDAAVDGGNLWHWTNTGGMLGNSDVFILGHRTSAGGPMRNLHQLPIGSLMYINTADGRQYTFRYAGMRLTGKDAASILAGANGFKGTTVSLVACTAGYARPGKAWYEPTSVEWRLVATFEFVDWQAL